MRVGVIAGGVSSEREVSLRSGMAVYNALVELGYDTVFIDAREEVCRVIKEAAIDVAFLTLHGGWGENGGIQGLLEILGIPYTGSGVLASALAMDKVMSKRLFQFHNIPVPPYKVFNRQDMSEIVREVAEELRYPVVVKPAQEGSSVGVSIVNRLEELKDAVELAFSYGSRILVEKFIEGKEINIGILGDRAIGGVEIRPKRSFYDYEAKYTKGLTEYILPPEIEDSLYRRLLKLGLDAHKALGCDGFSRVDMIVDREGNPYVLEVNTLPGMTETSLLPKIATLAGYDFKGLVKEILELTLRKHER